MTHILTKKGITKLDNMLTDIESILNSNCLWICTYGLITVINLLHFGWVCVCRRLFCKINPLVVRTNVYWLFSPNLVIIDMCRVFTSILPIFRLSYFGFSSFIWFFTVFRLFFLPSSHFFHSSGLSRRLANTLTDGLIAYIFFFMCRRIFISDCFHLTIQSQWLSQNMFVDCLLF